MPAEEKVICPGLSRASCTSSFTDLAGNSAFTTSRFGAIATIATGGTSFIGS